VGYVSEKPVMTIGPIIEVVRVLRALSMWRPAVFEKAARRVSCVPLLDDRNSRIKNADREKEPCGRLPDERCCEQNRHKIRQIGDIFPNLVPDP
jgi:hypothetical protein